MNYRVTYHVTSRHNLDSILCNGLIPQSPSDMVDEYGVYLFKTIEDVKNAILNWFGDRMDEWEYQHGKDYDAIILQISSIGLELIESEAEYELICKNVIPPSLISVTNELEL